MVIWSEFRMRQYKYNQEEAPLFKNCIKTERSIEMNHTSSIYIKKQNA